MKKQNLFKRVIVSLLTVLMLFGLIPTAVYAETATDPESTTPPQDETIMHELPNPFQIEEGKDGYTFISFEMEDGTYDKKGNPYVYSGYEKSQHVLKVNGNNAIAELFVLADASKTYGWEPSGIYSFGVSNYEVLYCCDRDTGFNGNVYYKRMNLEDSSYYDSEAAAHIRAIVTNSYPYVSIDRMKEILKADGFADADKLDRAEIIAAVQTAIWSYSNRIDVKNITYLQSGNMSKYPQYGKNLHDYSMECEAVKNLGTTRKVYTEIGERILALVEHLRGLDKVYAEKNAIIITKLEIVNASPMANSDGSYQTTVRVALNNGGSSDNDNIKLDIYVDGVLVKSKKVSQEISTYDVTVDAKAGQTIKAVVSGTQIIPQDVYFYEADGGREVSQSLVGVAAGETDVYAEASLELEKESDIPVNKTATALNKYAQTDVTLFVPGHYTGEDTDRVFCAAGSYVEDFIGYDPAVGDFEFITDAGTIKLVIGGVTYITEKIETVEGADASYSFTKPGADEPTFWLDYYRGNGTTTERFVWTFGEDVTLANNTALTYKLQLNELATVDGVYVIDTNLSATLYPRIWKAEAATYSMRSAIEFGDPVIFPVPSVEYKVARFIEGSKTWDDFDDIDGIRPDEITIKIYTGGEVIASKVVTAEDNWSWDFGEFPKYENGVEIEYTITEEVVPGYETVIDGFDITNVHVPKIEIEGSKDWNYGNNAGNLPEFITIRLFANGVEIASRQVTAADGWVWNFGEFDRFDETGAEIEYVIAEDEIEGYKTIVDGFNVINVELVEIAGSKTWEDEGYEANRPESITITLLANGEVVATKIVTAEDEWAWNFGELVKYDENGEAIEYTITEDEVAGYKSAVDGFNVTNTYIPTIDITVNKIWDDEDDVDGIRPGSITVNLLANGEVVAEIEITAEDGWTYTFAGLVKYDENGAEIEYTIEEDEVEGYETTIDGFEITNTHVPEIFEDPGDPEIPRDPGPATGGAATLFGWFTLAIASGALALTMLFSEKKRLANSK